ncbi:hypothetical protein [Paenibacillus sp. DMB5]|uniref:hypothetical protein n=1 Tax=Paenibacillus sp. DMB5 TaxID=1780103 RepID=UPI00076CC94F|nr:hypothetical protein [Paenibacillus sp. DMB5]KUP21566.1 hypothetical protein AWJ19_17790 [Paenibacillus sp. DMB5]
MGLQANADVILPKRMHSKNGTSKNTGTLALITSVKRIVILLMLLVIGILVTGCSQSNNVTVKELRELGADEIAVVFAEQGLDLCSSEVRAESVFHRELNGREPLVFLLDGEELVIYQFAGDGEREAGWADFENRTATAELVQHKVFQEQSLLIFYIGDEGKSGRVLFRQIEQVIPELLELRER